MKRPFQSIAVLLSAFLLAACTGPAWKQNPDMQAARAACAGLPEAERYACIERHATECLNPDVCRLAGTVVDNTPGARVVTLGDAGGVEWYVPWMDATIVRRADGTPAQFRDIARGMALDVAGFRRTQAATPNVLSAVRVTILDAAPAP